MDDKLDILETNGYPGSEVEFSIRPNQPVPEELLAVLRLQSLNGSDAFLLESIFRGEVWGHLSMPISEENERAVCEGMAEGARTAMSAYATTIEVRIALALPLSASATNRLPSRWKNSQEDLSRLRSVSAGSREEVALLARLGEKEALDTLVRFFEGRLGQLKSLEYYQERRLKRLGLMDDRGRSTYDSFFKDGVA